MRTSKGAYNRRCVQSFMTVKLALSKMVHISLIISILALAISIWNRVETFLNLKRQRKSELVKLVGEALVSAQILKNTLSLNLDELERVLKEKSGDEVTNRMILAEFSDKLGTVKVEYEQIWEFTKAFEKIVMHFEKGKSLAIETSSIEAKVAHFNQRRELALFDIQYLKDFVQVRIDN